MKLIDSSRVRSFSIVVSESFLLFVHYVKEEEVTEGKRLPLEEVDENACMDH